MTATLHQIPANRTSFDAHETLVALREIGVTEEPPYKPVAMVRGAGLRCAGLNGPCTAPRVLEPNSGGAEHITGERRGFAPPESAQASKRKPCSVQDALQA